MSFDEVYSQHYHELRLFGRQFNISPEKTEDLLQETFLRFYLELKKNIVFENPRAWLYKVLLNLFKTQLNSDKREPYNPENTIMNKNSSDDLQEEYLINEKQRIVFDMLNKLPEREKCILLLYHNGFSYAEMAEILGMNVNSVGKTIVRAIDKLKETIKLHYNEMFE
jgi:RNA polymerase sigma-70 factor (ECF subfamily)